MATIDNADSQNPKSKIQNPKSDVPAHIFREYDIRGVVDEDLSEDVYYSLGRAYGTFLYSQPGDIKPVKGQRMRVAAGRDVRLSSERYQKALTQGMLAS